MKTMKKQLRIAAVAGLVLLVAMFLVTCDADFFGPDKGKDKGELEYTDWEYKDNPDGTASLTLWLDGSTPVPVENNYRALGFEIARRSHDYFEAVFVAGTTSNLTIARTNWEIGQAAGIRGVARGVDYAEVNAGFTTTASAGIAYIAVGRKQGERTATLLATGFLSAVDGDTTETSVTPATRNVTFTVAALTTRIGYNFTLDTTGAPTAITDSFPGNALTNETGAFDRDTFLTAAKDNNDSVGVSNTLIGTAIFKGGATYTMFGLPGWDKANAAEKLAGEILVPAKYTLRFLGLNKIPTPPLDVEVPVGTDLFEGLLYYGYSIDPTMADLTSVPADEKPIQFMERIGLYNVSGQRYDVTEMELDTATTVRLLGGDTAQPAAGTGFNRVIDLEFRIVKESSGAFAFTFQIPVYAITHARATNGGPDFTKWYIRPGHGTSQYLLDNGSTAGGAVLMGVGVSSIDWIDIIVEGFGFTN